MSTNWEHNEVWELLTFQGLDQLPCDRDEKPSDMTVPITAAVIVLALILIAATGFVIYKKKTAQCLPSPPDSSSELSEELNPET